MFGGLIWLKIAETFAANRAGGARTSEMEAKRKATRRASLRYREKARITEEVECKAPSI